MLQIETYEASTVLNIQPNATLNDIHQTAWRIFTHHDTQYKTLSHRPFLFRYDMINGAKALIQLRSQMPFHGAKQKQLVVEEGRTVHIDLAMVPTRRRKNKAYTPSSADWPQLWLDKMVLAGVNVSMDDVEIQFLGRRQFKARNQRFSLVNGRIAGVITDAHAFKKAWVHGVGRHKAYGCGLLRNVP